MMDECRYRLWGITVAPARTCRDSHDSRQTSDDLITFPDHITIYRLAHHRHKYVQQCWDLLRAIIRNWKGPKKHLNIPLRVAGARMDIFA